MARGKRLDNAAKNAIIETHRTEHLRYKEIAERFGLSTSVVGRIIKEHTTIGAGITLEEATEKHNAAMQENRIPNDYMEHVTPLHQHKQQLETQIAQKKEELSKLMQEYRNYLATIRELAEEKV